MGYNNILKYKKKILVTIFASTVSFSAFADLDPAAFAKSLLPNSANVPILPAFTDADAQYLQDKGCDPAVWNEMTADYQAEIQRTINNSRNANVINNFANLAPNVTDSAQNCGLSQMLGPIAQIGDAATSIIAAINGDGSGFKELGKQAMQKMQNQACSYANNMASGVINKSGLGGINNSINSVSNLNAGSIQTPLGTINSPNVGDVVSTLGQRSSGTTSAPTSYGPGTTNSSQGVTPPPVRF